MLDGILDGISDGLLDGMSEIAKVRPDNPVEWLAAFLLRNNPQGPSGQQQSQQG